MVGSAGRGVPAAWHAPPLLPTCYVGALWKPASIASLLWIIGFFLNTSAVLLGGNAASSPIVSAVLIMTSGAAGIVYYREFRSVANAALWSLAALVTTAFVILLANERLPSTE